MFALESAMDELAVALRARPDRAPHPQRARASTPSPACRSPAATWSPACARAPAGSAGSAATPTPRARRESGWLVGTGVAASTYPSPRLPGNAATIRVGADGRYTVRIGAADIGTGTWTALTQIAADALGRRRRGRRPADR